MNEGPLTIRLLARLGRAVIARPDRLSGVVLMAVAIGALVEASDLPFGSLRQPDSGFFPKSLASLLLLFGLGIGSLEASITRVEQAMGWRVRVIPFFYRVRNGFNFLRNIEYLKTQPGVSELGFSLPTCFPALHWHSARELPPST